MQGIIITIAFIAIICSTIFYVKHVAPSLLLICSTLFTGSNNLQLHVLPHLLVNHLLQAFWCVHLTIIFNCWVLFAKTTISDFWNKLQLLNALSCNIFFCFFEIPHKNRDKLWPLNTLHSYITLNVFSKIELLQKIAYSSISRLVRELDANEMLVKRSTLSTIVYYVWHNKLTLIKMK